VSHVVVIGNGGREHAIAWKLAHSPSVTKLTLAPGNSLFRIKKRNNCTLQLWECDLSLGQKEFKRLSEIAKKDHVDLVIVGPDNPLSEGIVDVFQRDGLLCFGPTAKAAQIESSKSFAKQIMQKANVPTPDYFEFTNLNGAIEKLNVLPWSQDKGWVIKADGLALGKGVVVCDELSLALKEVEPLFNISKKIIIEEKVKGVELSVLALCDGEDCVLLDTAKDYKRIFDNDKGPNTGGMGVFSPVVEFNTARWKSKFKDEIFTPVLKQLKKEGLPFCGVLYAGLMIDQERGHYHVLEFNARFGDPETQALLSRMEDDLFQWCYSCAKGKLSQKASEILFSNEVVVYVVAASQGYPASAKKGDQLFCENSDLLNALDLSEPHPRYFMAGVKKSQGEKIVTNGGRVLGAIGKDLDFSKATEKAYSYLSHLKFEGMQFRNDIGLRGSSS